MISVDETLESLHREPQRERERLKNMSEKEYMHSMEDTRPDWDTWFMTLAFVVAQRSLDKHTKHGCVVVDGDSRAILSIGYNSPPRGCIDSEIPLNRPDKYLYMEHSESNAITNAARCGVSLDGSTFYVTGPPCHDCFRKIINVGATKLVQGPILHKRTDEQMHAIEIMNNQAGSNSSSITVKSVDIFQFSDMEFVSNLLSNTNFYINSKLEEQR